MCWLMGVPTPAPPWTALVGLFGIVIGASGGRLLLVRLRRPRHFVRCPRCGRQRVRSSRRRLKEGPCHASRDLLPGRHPGSVPAQQ
ncbi:XapX domain-containing protein [Streptomyces sp. NPDC057555]|uniref:XapX domain-containing protein n=1 Tax=Streptomyces sp. NPDC057555 TaxID=3346166 RepID=UPI0036A6C29E